jgi:cytochrome P450
MLGSFVAHGVTQQECESESILQILAGADSTATTLRCTLLYVLTNPPVHAKLLVDIKTAANNGKISHPVDKYAEATELTYLQACIKEGLRMWQPLNGLGRRFSPPEGRTINDVHIPGGVEVGVSLHTMMRRKDLFGHDAESFRPERWIESDQETLHLYGRTLDLSFGSGRTELFREEYRVDGVEQGFC